MNNWREDLIRLVVGKKVIYLVNNIWIQEDIVKEEDLIYYFDSLNKNSMFIIIENML